MECVLCEQQPSPAHTGGANPGQTRPAQEQAPDEQAGADQRQLAGGMDDAHPSGDAAALEVRTRRAAETANNGVQEAGATAATAEASAAAESAAASQPHANGAGAGSASSPPASSWSPPASSLPAPHQAARGKAPQAAPVPDLDAGVDVRIKITTLNIQLNKSGGGMMMSWLYRMLLSAFSERIRASVEQAVVHALQVPLSEQSKGRECVYVSPGCFAHPGARTFWLGGGCKGGRLSKGIGSVGDDVGEGTHAAPFDCSCLSGLWQQRE
jgi:hypothetical protein